jgi:hypothetical protein
MRAKAIILSLFGVLTSLAGGGGGGFFRAKNLAGHPVAAVLAGDAQLFELLAIPAAHVMDSSSIRTTLYTEITAGGPRHYSRRSMQCLWSQMSEVRQMLRVMN